MICRNAVRVPVVICDQALPDGGWKSLLAELEWLPLRPSLVVSSRHADLRLWAEVLNLGAHDLLLASPFEPEEVLRVTESAWRASERRIRPANVPRAQASSGAVA